MSGMLYLVGTPIGNLQDMSPRALQVLESVDFIAAEDTRVTAKLLNYFGIKKPMVSYYEHNLRERGEQIIARLMDGQNAALVTDAGMPCISDPGADLVALAADAGIELQVVPGPSAVIAALCLSGLDTSRFTFEGFLTVKRTGRMQRLEQLKTEGRTMVFYEAPHKLLTTLQDLCQVFGGQRKIALVREITKIHEQVVRTTLQQAVERYTAQPPRGEFVLVVAGAPPVLPEEHITLQQAVQLVCEQIGQGMPVSQAARTVAKQTGYKKGQLYQLAIAAQASTPGQTEQGEE